MQQRGVVGVDVTLVAIGYIQVLYAWLEGLGIALGPVHRTIEHHLAVNLELRQHAVGRIIKIGCVAAGTVLVVVGETVRNILLVMGRHQLGFGIDTAPTVGQRQAERRFHMQTGGVRAIGVDADKLGGLTINAEIERAEILFIVVQVELRLNFVGV